jgi:CheY-like chemotaxis protein
LQTPISPRLLVVDDLLDNRVVLGRPLERAGYRVDYAAGGAEALERVGSGAYDLVLLDLMMPDLDGFEVLERIRSRYSDRELPVIMVTASSAVEDVVKALSMGANDFITKPGAFEVTAARVRNLTAGKLADEALRSAAAELKSVTVQLREERDFLQEVFDHLDNGIAVLDGGRLVVANRRLGELLQAAPEHCRTGEDLLHPGSAAADGDLAPIAKFTGEAAEWLRVTGPARCEMTSPDGRVLELRRRMTSSGKQLGLANDITERTQAAERHHQSQKMEALGELAGGVAHEFNNLLQVICGFTHTAMAQVEDPGRVRSALEEVLTASGRASDLSQQMLTFSRNWVGEGKVIAVDRELEQLSRLLSFDSRGVRVELDVEPDLRVTLDKTHFGQVMMNLAINARDSMPKGGVLTVSAHHQRAANPITSCVDVGATLPPGDYVEISVSDQGSGIPHDVLPRIFEPFFTTKRIGKGTGLGLSFVFGVVKQAGGTIQVESVLGQGSTFRLVLPQTSRPLSPELREGGYHGGHETVLVVDDEDQVRAVTATLLERLGYTVLQASGGLHALEVFDQEAGRIDLVLTDVAMPDIDGFDLAGLLQEMGCQAPIAFMTGCVPDLERHDGRFAAAQGSILQKPFRMRDLAVFTRGFIKDQAA